MKQRLLGASLNGEFVKRVGLTILLLILGGCSNNEFSVQDRKILESNGIDNDVSQKFKSISVGVGQLYTLDKEYRQSKAIGIILKVKPETGTNVVRSLRSKLKESSYQAYFYDNHYGYENDEVAIVPTKDDLDYLRKVRTDGINYSLTADDVLKKYSEWKERYDLKLFGAGRDWLEAEITVNDVNWVALAKEVYEFCPDVVDQGTGSVEALSVEMEKNRTLYLWWD